MALFHGDDGGIGGAIAEGAVEVSEEVVRGDKEEIRIRVDRRQLEYILTGDTPYPLPSCLP